MSGSNGTSIWSRVFGSGGNNTVNPQQPNAGGHPVNPGSAAGNTTVPNNQNNVTPAAPAGMVDPAKTPESPLAKFEDLWKLPDTSKTGTPPSLRPTFQVDPAKMMEAAKGVDFTRAVSPELLDKAIAGDKAALAAAMNAVGQAGYAQAALSTTKIVENALGRQADAFEALMPDMVRKYTVTAAVQTDNSIFSNPAVAPMLTSLEQQLASRYTGETPAQISARAKEFLGAVANEIVKGQGGTVTMNSTNPGGEASNPLSRKQDDWGSYFGVTG